MQFSEKLICPVPKNLTKCTGCCVAYCPLWFQHLGRATIASRMDGPAYTELPIRVGLFVPMSCFCSSPTARHNSYHPPKLNPGRRQSTRPKHSIVEQERGQYDDDRQPQTRFLRLPITSRCHDHRKRVYLHRSRPRIIYMPPQRGAGCLDREINEKLQHLRLSHCRQASQLPTQAHPTAVRGSPS